MLYTDNIKDVKVFPVVFENINRNMVVANNITELYEQKPADGARFWYLDFLKSAALDEKQLKDWKINAIQTIQTVCWILSKGQSKCLNINSTHEDRCKLATAMLTGLITQKD